MDVVNGKIVSARADQRVPAEVWNGLKPSRGRTVETSEHVTRGGWEWAPSWAAPYPSCFPAAVPVNVWGGAAPCHGRGVGLGIEPSSARSSHRLMSEMFHPAGTLHEYRRLQQPRAPLEEHREGWGCHQKRHSQFGSKSCSLSNLDQMMTMYESQIIEAVSGHFAEAVVTISSSLGQETSIPPAESKESKECSLKCAASDAGSKLLESETLSSSKSTVVPVRMSSDLKRKCSDLKRKHFDIQPSSKQDPADCGWSQPLKLLVRKGLSVSDVGELGRIVIPKKCAESQFSQVDTREGTLLEMEDYDGSKRWCFRFKWWNNNKSRMYVLENTGDFIKYHSLKERDIFVVYEDNSSKMVVRGHKSTDSDSTLDILQGTNVGSSSDQSLSTKEEGSAPTPVLA